MIDLLHHCTCTSDIMLTKAHSPTKCVFIHFYRGNNFLQWWSYQYCMFQLHLWSQSIVKLIASIVSWVPCCKGQLTKSPIVSWCHLRLRVSSRIALLAQKCTFHSYWFQMSSMNNGADTLYVFSSCLAQLYPNSMAK